MADRGPCPAAMELMRRHALLPKVSCLFQFHVGSVGYNGVSWCPCQTSCCIRLGHMALEALHSFLLECSLQSISTQACTCVQDLNYRVRNNAKSSERITLLYKVSGYLLPGHLSVLVSRQPFRPCKPVSDLQPGHHTVLVG